MLIAIEYENIEMMEVLLSFNVEVRDALLHAINEENVEAVEMLLKYQQNVHKQKNLQVCQSIGCSGKIIFNINNSAFGVAPMDGDIRVRFVLPFEVLRATLQSPHVVTNNPLDCQFKKLALPFFLFP